MNPLELLGTLLSHLLECDNIVKGILIFFFHSVLFCCYFCGCNMTCRKSVFT